MGMVGCIANSGSTKIAMSKKLLFSWVFLMVVCNLKGGHFASTGGSLSPELCIPINTVPGANICHVLEFDGLAYHSKVWIPAVESKLVPSHRNLF